MNRHGRSSYVGGASSSKASSNTVCQKCLRKGMCMSCVWRILNSDSSHFCAGHYSYECKAQAQERPYISRPSRSQQFLNPKLKPKLANIAPEPSEQEYVTEKSYRPCDLLTPDRKSSATRDLGKEVLDSLHKNSSGQMDNQKPSRKRSRSASSSYSSPSVSSISTRSPSPDRARRRRSTDRHPASHRDDRENSASGGAGDKRRRRSSTSLPSDHTSSYDSHNRNTRMRRSSRSPSERGRRRGRSANSDRRMRSASGKEGIRDTRGLTDSARPDDSDHRPSSGQRTDLKRTNHASHHDQDREMREVPAMDSRTRSLSPFSKRLALTQAMNR